MMCASTTVAAAIEYLDELQADRGYSEANGWLCEYSNGDPSPLTNDPLIVALYRTIDTQLVILRNAHRTCVAQESRGEVPKGPALDLAAAILGGIA